MAEPFRFVHAADVHLDSPLRGLDRYEGAPVERMRGATRLALANLVELCIDEGASFLVLAGDLYDGSWRDYSTGLFFAAQMTRLKRAGIRVFLVRGNHDAASQITRHLRLPDNVHDFDVQRAESVELERLGVAIHGHGFAQKATTDDLASRYPDARRGLLNVGVLHTSVGGREGHETYAPCSLHTLASKGYDYWALGHVHTREVLSTEPWVVFPGNLQGRHARETGDKGASVVTFSGGKILSVEHRSLDVVRWAACEIDCSDAGREDDVVELAKAEMQASAALAGGRPLAVRVVLRGGTPLHDRLAAYAERIANEIRVAAGEAGEAVWVEKVVFRTQASRELAEALAAPGPVGDVIHALAELRRSDAALLELARELADLQSKLAPEMREGEDGVRLDDPGYLRRALDDAERILLPRLLDGARGEGER